MRSYLDSSRLPWEIADLRNDCFCVSSGACKNVQKYPGILAVDRFLSLYCRWRASGQREVPECGTARVVIPSWFDFSAQRGKNWVDIQPLCCEETSASETNPQQRGRQRKRSGMYLSSAQMSGRLLMNRWIPVLRRLYSTPVESRN